MCQEETPDIEAQELVKSLKLRRVSRIGLNDQPDDERGCKELHPETRARRKNMRDSLKDAAINDCRPAMGNIEGIHQRNPSDRTFRPPD